MSTQRVLHLSDTHLLEAAGARLYGRDMDANFSAALGAARTGGPYDLVVLTGDISHDGSRASYERAVDMLGNIDYQRLVAIAGNHDDPITLSEVIPSEPCALGAWQVVLLNSHWPERVEGRLGAEQEALLRDALAAIDEQNEAGYALVAVHHPPHFICSTPHCALSEPESLLQLASHDAVRLLISGHVHDDYSHRIGATMFSTCPSTCIGFDHDPAGHKASTLPPGAIIYDLGDDGSIGRKAIYAP